MEIQSLRKVSFRTRDLERRKIKFTVENFRNYFEKILTEKQAKMEEKYTYNLKQLLPQLLVLDMQEAVVILYSFRIGLVGG